MSRILIVIRESRSPRRSVRRGTLADSTPPHAAAFRGSTAPYWIRFTVARSFLRIASSGVPGGQSAAPRTATRCIRPPSAPSKKKLFAKTTWIARNVTRIHDVEPRIGALSGRGLARDHAEVICERSAFTNLLDNEIAIFLGKSGDCWRVDGTPELSCNFT